MARGLVAAAGGLRPGVVPQVCAKLGPSRQVKIIVRLASSIMKQVMNVISLQRWVLESAARVMHGESRSGECR